ncbi:hypothetical protein ABPG72_014599 [Tetrahymena utriculariae]
MCLISGISKNGCINLTIFILPQVLIISYILFVLHITHLAKRIQLLPQYYQDGFFQDEDKLNLHDEFYLNSGEVIKKIEQYMEAIDKRFDKDEKLDGNFSEIAEIDMLIVENGKKLMDFQKFYHDFQSYNMPIVLRNAVKHWKAIHKWQSDQYLVSKIGDREVQVEVRKDGENKFAYFSKNFVKSSMKYQEFIQLYKDPNRKANYYLAEFGIPEEIVDDIEEIDFGLFMNLEYTNFWQGASGTESLPHTDDKDNFLCQITGKKTIILIPPTQRPKLYVGAGKNKIKNYSQVDFFNPNLQNFPLFSQIKGKMKVEINPGDALFIPSFWWHHVKSSNERNLAINFWYTPNYMHSLFQSILESDEFN